MALLAFVIPVIVIFALRIIFVRVRTFLAVYSQLKRTPGGVHIHLTEPQSILAPILPHLPYGALGDYNAKCSPYQKSGRTILASTPVWHARPMFWVCDPAALKHVAAERVLFPKQTELYEIISFFGPNLVSTEGRDWKRHRDVAKGAFGEANNALVWGETLRVAREFFDTINDNDTTPVCTHDIFTRIALLIISAAGFGRNVSFANDVSPAPPPGYALAFRPALLTAVHNMSVKVVTPSWLSRFPITLPIIQRTELAYAELRRHLGQMIETTRRGDTGEWAEPGDAASGKADLFLNLIKANDGDGEKGRTLSDDELLSNTYTFLLAGHETTANTLTFALALLALHPHIQSKLQAEADVVWPLGLPSHDDVARSYREDVPGIKYAEAVFRETLRLFPSEVRLTKRVADDTILRGTLRATGEQYDVPVPAGSVIWMDVWATHMMPEYWGLDAAEFKPERFFDTESYKWPRDAYLPFSLGARSCIGARFATLEGIALLAAISRRFHICLPPALAALPLVEQRRRLLGWGIGVALTAKDYDLLFVKRD